MTASRFYRPLKLATNSNVRLGLYGLAVAMVGCGAEKDPEDPANLPPVVSIQILDSPIRNSLVIFDASQSSDHESTINALDFEWEQTEGPDLRFLTGDSTALTGSRLYAVVGEEPVELQLTVSDGQSTSSQRIRLFDPDCEEQSGSDVVCVAGLLNNTAPVAGVSVTEIEENASAYLDATRTVDQETADATLNYRWEIKQASETMYQLFAEGGVATAVIESDEAVNVRLTLSDGEFADSLIVRLFDDSCELVPDEDFCLLAPEEDTPPLLVIREYTDMPDSDTNLVLDASRTADVETERGALTFQWRQLDGEPLEFYGQTLTESALLVGVSDSPATLELEVNDGSHSLVRQIQLYGPDCVAIDSLNNGCGAPSGTEQ